MPHTEETLYEEPMLDSHVAIRSNMRILLKHTCALIPMITVDIELCCFAYFCSMLMSRKQQLLSLH